MEFNKAYNRNELVKFLRTSFLPEDFIQEKTPLANPKQFQYTQQVTRLGECKSMELVVFEVLHSSVSDARVGLTKEAFRMLADEFCERALVFFVPQDDNSNYRFSLIEITLEQTEGSAKVQRTFSNPHRYSYYLGEGVATHTPDAYLQPKQNSRVKNVEDLRKRFSVEVLTNDFYNKLFNWYLWATDSQTGITFPNKTNTEIDDRDRLEVKMIRLITRMLFVWFIKQKRLVPSSLFDEENMKNILLDFDPESTTDGCYYNAILQNLFFATLNQEIESRAFITPSSRGRSESFGVKNLYRDDSRRSWFLFPEKGKEARIKELFSSIPYLNGGLFECLDKTKQINGEEYFYDGFSSKGVRQGGNLKYRAFVPNMLFFAKEHRETVHVTEKETKDVEVMGLLELFKLYNFTVEENTSSDVEVSLDPELLGHVFENLLAAYNPETQESARKSTGSFYTPRVIVDYMVDESLKAYLKRIAGDLSDIIDELFSELFVYDPACRATYERIETSLRDIKVLDPACGSGAFPMGILLRITEIIGKLHPEGFDSYQTKLDIIKRCIYGVDIQPIAMMICKLRFFISLICDCERDESKPNFGIIPLPNLETKFVAANSLLPAKVKSFMGDWTRDENLVRLQQELLDLRQSIVDLRKYSDKKNNKTKDREKCREIKDYIRQSANQPNFDKIKQLEKQIAKDEACLPLYEGEYWIDEQTQPQTSLFEVAEPTIFRHDLNQEKRTELQARIARCRVEIEKERSKRALPGFEDAVNEVTLWDPYDQNAVSPFFDAKWMFGVNEGFDIVIGNPPYFNIETLGANSTYAESVKRVFSDIWQDKSDILFYFFGLALNLSKDVVCYITSNAYLFSDKAKKLRNRLLEDERLNRIVNFEKYKIFGSASITTCITLLSLNHKDFSAVNVEGIDYSLKTLIDFIQDSSNTHSVHLKKNSVFALVTSQIDEINDKIDGSHKKLNTLFKIGSGMQTGANEVFCFKEFPLQFQAKYIKYRMSGEAINKYTHELSKEYLLYVEDVANFESLPKIIQNYLIENKVTLCNRAQIKRSSSSVWWKYVFPMHKDYYHLNKIWCSYRSKTNTFALDESMDYIGLTNTTVIFDTNNHLSIKYLLALLNSKTLTFRYKSIGKQTGGGIFEFFENGVGKLPIPEISREKQNCFIELIDQILVGKRSNYTADTSELENKIDLLVYHLYDLTYDEVLIVDPETPITREEYESSNSK